MRKSIYYQPPYQQIFVKEVKAPIARALNILTRSQSNKLDKYRAFIGLWKVPLAMLKLPEPTVENTRKQGTHVLIGIRDKFFRCLKLPKTDRMIKMPINFVIMVYDTDFYQSFIDFWVHELKKSDWPPIGPLQPDPHFWKNE